MTKYTVNSSFSSSGLAEAFTKIEDHDKKVEKVKMHPDLLKNFYKDHKREVFDEDEEGNLSVWGADVSLEKSHFKQYVVLQGGGITVYLKNTENRTENDLVSGTEEQAKEFTEKLLGK